MLGIPLLFILFTGVHGFDPEKHVNWKLLPHENCGKVETNRIVGGKIAPLNSYPWIVRVGLTLKFLGLINFPCGGVLVNSETVLSAAHCVSNIPIVLEVGPIRLGEHDLRTDPDCERGYCADMAIDMPVSFVIIPENQKTEPLENDVVLIKLQRKVYFTESVSPICIGEKLFYEKDFAGKVAEVAGWGVRDMGKMEMSKILEVVKLPVQSEKTCKTWYAEKNFPISPHHICVGGEEGVDSCNGDSGGPLMIVDDGKDGPRYFLLGIVSLGPVHCGRSQFPGLYLKTSAFIKWFLDNLSHEVKF